MGDGVRQGGDDTAQLVTWACEVIAVVHELYREGRQGQKLACPSCGFEHDFYRCAWDYNKHVWYACPKCGLQFQQ